MYPDLSYVIHDLIGTEPDNWTSIFKTFGLLLACALLAAGWVLKKELVRLENEGKISATKQKVKAASTSISDVITNGLIALFFGSKIPYIIGSFADFQADPAGVIFSGKGSWSIGLLIGSAVAIYLYLDSKKEPSAPIITEAMVSPHEKTSDIVILAGLSGAQYHRLTLLATPDAEFFSPKTSHNVVKTRFGLGFNIHQFTHLITLRAKAYGSFNFNLEYDRDLVPDEFEYTGAYAGAIGGIGLDIGFITVDFEYEKGLVNALSMRPDSKLDIWTMSAGFFF